MSEPYRVIWADAFSDRPLEGNACAVVLDADDLGERQMQSIAREFNLSETAFVMRSEVADFRARYFTPAEEIPLAGHPTIATVHALLEVGALPRSDHLHVSLELRDGPVQVTVRVDDGVREIAMRQRRPVFLSRYEASEVLPWFGLTAGARCRRLLQPTPVLPARVHPGRTDGGKALRGSTGYL